MIIFIIPLKNREVAASWDKTLSLLSQTLKSVLNQTSDDFKTIIVSGEPININDDPKIEYLSTNTKYTDILDAEGKRVDKAGKLKIGLERAITYNPDYVMPVDADDFISKNLVEYIEKNHDNNIGFCLNEGYMFDGNEMFYCRNGLSKFCGTTLITKPEFFHHTFEGGLYQHFQDNMIKGIMMPDIPFASVIYNKGNGENFSPDTYIYGIGVSCFITQEIVDEFSFPQQAAI